MRFENPRALLDAVGRVIGESQWIDVDAERIRGFADVTGDHQWIHVDEERARLGPFGTIIAHGYLTLSLIGGALPEILDVGGIRVGINYGLNRVRFLSPVPAGSRVRLAGVLTSAMQRDDDAIDFEVEVSVMIEGNAKPACVAQVLGRHYY